MNMIKQFKRNFLIRLMSALGFGGMAAFCLASCQPATNEVQQPKQETSSKTTPEAVQSNAPGAVETPELVKEPVPEVVADPTVPSAEPPADTLPAPEHPSDTLPAPELPSDTANPDEDAQIIDLKPELTEDGSETIPGPVVAPPIVTKYGVKPPPGPVKKYGIKPAPKYGPPHEHGL